MYEIGHIAARDIPGVVVVGGSAGGIEALMALLDGLPVAFPFAIVVAQHLGASSRYRSALRDVLQRRSPLPVDWATERTRLAAGRIYLCPQDQHVRCESRTTVAFAPSAGHRRPHIDTLFASAADIWGTDATGVVLSGYLDDGAAGAREICRAGGTVFIQDRKSSLAFDMPEAALRAGTNALVMPVGAIAAALITVTVRSGAGAWFRVTSGSPYLATV